MKTRDICVLAVLTATLTGGKMALAFLANIEIVTSLLIVYTLVFKIKRTLIVCVVFTLIDCFIWGFGWWVILYLSYWPLLVVLVGILPKIKIRIVLAIAIGIAMTAFFGAFSTAIEIVMLGGLGESFWLYYYYRYMAGVPFFIMHIVSNSIILTLLVPALYPIVKKCNYLIMQK